MIRRGLEIVSRCLEDYWVKKEGEGKRKKETCKFESERGEGRLSEEFLDISSRYYLDKVI